MQTVLLTPVDIGSGIIVLQFELPLAFLLLPLPILIFWISPEFRDQAEAVRVPFFKHIVKLSKRKPTSGDLLLAKTWIQRMVVGCCWTLIIIALANPQWLGTPITRESSARDMLLIIDLSESMNEKDFTSKDARKISRLNAVKEVLEEFIQRRKADRLGLAVFGNAAYPQAPFTQDHQTVLTLLDELQVNMAGAKTMIGDAIGLAVRLFESSKSNNKVVILLTDGNDTGSQMPIGKASMIAAENGIVIHTIAMGDPSTTGEKQLDLSTLKNISDDTRGKFFVALNREELDEIYKQLDSLEPEKIESITYRPKSSLFHYPLGAALILVLLLALSKQFLGKNHRENLYV